MIKTILQKWMVLVLSCGTVSVYGECQSCTLRSESHQDDLSQTNYYEDTEYFNSNLRKTSKEVSLGEESLTPLKIENEVPKQEKEQNAPKRKRETKRTNLPKTNSKETAKPRQDSQESPK